MVEGNGEGLRAGRKDAQEEEGRQESAGGGQLFTERAA